MNENLTPYPADDSLQRAKAEADELLRELDKLRQASKQECQQLYFQAIFGKAETLSTRREESENDSDI